MINIMKKKIVIIIMLLSLLALGLFFRFSANSSKVKEIKIIADKEDFEKVYKRNKYK